MTLQQIPTGWKKIKLSNPRYTHIILGQSPPSSSYNDIGEGIPFIQGNAEFGFKYAVPNQYTTDPTKIAEKKDILVSVRAPVGDVNYSPEKICIGRGIAAIRPNKKNLETDFVYYSLIHYVNRFHALSTGTTFKAISKRDFDDFLLPVPPLPEQRGIVEVLGTMDECIRLTDAVIERAEELKRGLMQRLLTRGIGHTEYKETPLGEIPKTWKIIRFSEEITLRHGFQFREHHFRERGIPVVKIEQLKADRDIDLSNCNFVSENLVKQLKNKTIQQGDILMALTGGTLGKVTRVRNFYGTILQNYRVGNFIIKNEDRLDKDFLYFILYSTYFRTQMFMKVNQAAQPNIGKNDMNNIKLKLPPHKEQKKIATILTTLEENIIILKNKSKKLIHMKQGLMQILLSGKIRVELKGDELHRIGDGREANN